MFAEIKHKDWSTDIWEELNEKVKSFMQQFHSTVSDMSVLYTYTCLIEVRKFQPFNINS